MEIFGRTLTLARGPIAPPAPALPATPLAPITGVGPAPEASDLPEDEAPVKRLGESKPMGASGTINQQGYLQPFEYVHELRGRAALDVWDRVRNDGAVEEALGHMIEPIVAALTDMQIEPASQEVDDLYAAELCRLALQEWLDQDWQEFCRQALEMLPFGHSVFEITEQLAQAPVTIEVENPDGTVTEQTHPNDIWRVPLRFAPRLQRTIWRWISLDGTLQAIEQQVFDDEGQFQNVTIPASNLMVFTLRRSGDNYMGRSILRAAYKSWYLKDVVEKTMVVAIESHGVGVWSVYMPEGHQDDDSMADRIEEILAGLRSGEHSYVVWPFPKAGGSQSTSTGIVAEILTPPGGLPTNLVDVAEYFRGDIKAALLTRFSELGHASVGARSVGEVQTEVWHRSLESVGALICNVLRRRLDVIVKDNLPGASTPHIKPGVLESKNLTEFATAVAAVVSSGAIEPDKSLREWVRTEMGAPDEDEGTDEALQREQDAGANIPPPGTQPPDPNADPNANLPGDGPPGSGA